MNHLFRFPLLLLLATWLIACQAAEEGYLEQASTADSQPTDYSSYTLGIDEEQPPKTTEARLEQPSSKIIYTADLRMQVEDIESSLQQLKVLVAKAGGHISSQYAQDNRYQKTVQLSLRLPAPQLEGSLEALAALGSFVDHKQLESQDVTAEWIDLESRLNTKRAVRDRYLEILVKKAVKVEDILAAEDKIRHITEEIEAKEGQLRYLRDRVNLSTLNVHLYQTQTYREAPATYKKSFGQQLAAAFVQGSRLFTNLLLALVSGWPFLLALGLGSWLWRRWRKTKSSQEKATK